MLLFRKLLVRMKELMERQDEVERKLETFKQEHKVDLELVDKKAQASIDAIVDRVKNEVERRLIEFHKEIADKYFQTLEKILRFGKEISVIDSLAHRVNDADLKALEQRIMKPIIEARYKEEGKKVEETVKSFGEEILQKRKELHDAMIKKEREEEDVTSLKEQIVLIDYIIKGVKK